MISLREAKYDPVHDAQQHFRVLLDSMAHPGQVHELDTGSLTPPAGLDACGAAIALALLNSEVTFAAYGHSDAAMDYLRQNTRSSLAETAADADFLFFRDATKGLAALAAAQVGHPAYPETGATVVIQVERLGAEGVGDGALTVLVEGPGVDGVARFRIQGLSTAVLAVLREKNEEYPLGIDTIFTCGARLVSIPRSGRLRWE